MTSTDTSSWPVSFLTVKVKVAESDTSADGMIRVTDVAVCCIICLSSSTSGIEFTAQVGVGAGRPSKCIVITTLSPGTVLIEDGADRILAGTETSI